MPRPRKLRQFAAAYTEQDLDELMPALPGASDPFRDSRHFPAGADKGSATAIGGSESGNHRQLGALSTAKRTAPAVWPRASKEGAETAASHGYARCPAATLRTYVSLQPLAPVHHGARSGNVGANAQGCAAGPGCGDRNHGEIVRSDGSVLK